MSETWQHVCVLCAARDRRTRLETGHVCPVCQQRLLDDLSAIGELAIAAAAYVAPGASVGGYATGTFGSRPPIRLDACDPELTVVHPDPDDPEYGGTILELLESWERAVREDRGMARYGPVSEQRAMLAGAAADDTRVTLIGCTSFLRSQVPWMATAVEFAVDAFAVEVRACVRALRRWSDDAQDRGTMVRCPTILEDGAECGYPLRYYGSEDHVQCRRCGAGRDVATLIAVAAADGREVWLDPEAAAAWLGVSESYLRRLARAGRIERSHGRYRITRHAEMATGT